MPQTLLPDIDDAQATDGLIELESGEFVTPEEAQEIEARKQDAVRKAVLQSLANKVRDEFNIAKAHRLDMERRWIEDLRQYKGVYDADTQLKLENSKKSKLFLRLTRAKVKSTNARMSDMLFPAGDKNWTINPTPVPDVDEDAWAPEIQQIVASTGQMPDPEALKAAIKEVAKERCENMAKEIDDQLEEGGYESECRRVIASGNLFGTGILKGPMGTPRVERRWRKRQGQWGISGVQSMKPGFNFIPIWHFYPDPVSTELKACAFEIEWHPMRKMELQRLREDEAFMADEIDALLREFPDGTANSLEQWESDLRLISKEERNKPGHAGRYVVLERWGTVSGRELIAAGMDAAAFEEHLDYEAQVWVCGDRVIRAQINPYETGSRPYKVYYFDKDETSIWGEGIPAIFRDPQRGANTAIRALTDNAAASAVPMFEVNTDLTPDEEDHSSILSGRVWKRKGRGIDSQYDAVRMIDIPARTEQFMSMLKLFIEMGDEVTTLPRYTYGSNDGSSVSKTVGGLSMLMGQANISLKENVKSWDDGITTPFIGDLYAWNMQFSDKENIKGDYDVIARGSSSLVAKEVRANALGQFTMDLLNGAPELAKKRELYSERARNLDLDPDVYLLSEDEAAANDTGRIAQEALMSLAEALGLPPEGLLQNIGQIAEMAKVGMAAQAAPMVPAGQSAMQ